MMNSTKDVYTLVHKAANADDALHAMQLAQAALNAANAIRVLADMPTKD